MNNLKQFMRDLNEFDIVLNQQQQEQFLKYYELLVEWNGFMNLTTITDFDEVLKKHFTDSLSLVKVYDKIRTEAVRVIDIGTGAGFPGIPLKIVFPQIKLTLLDSLQKRLKFLGEVCEQLKLQDVKFIHGRAEDLAKPAMEREKFDLCVSRAVANLSTLSELCLPYVRVGGNFISYKTEKGIEEAQQAKHAIFLLGGKIGEQCEFDLPDSDIHRNLFVINKVSETPKKYPRKAGLPAKEPLQ